MKTTLLTILAFLMLGSCVLSVFVVPSSWGWPLRIAFGILLFCSINFIWAFVGGNIRYYNLKKEQGKKIKEQRGKLDERPAPLPSIEDDDHYNDFAAMYMHGKRGKK